MAIKAIRKADSPTPMVKISRWYLDYMKAPLVVNVQLTNLQLESLDFWTKTRQFKSRLHQKNGNNDQRDQKQQFADCKTKILQILNQIEFGRLTLLSQKITKKLGRKNKTARPLQEHRSCYHAAGSQRLPFLRNKLPSSIRIILVASRGSG